MPDDAGRLISRCQACDAVLAGPWVPDLAAERRRLREAGEEAAWHDRDGRRCGPTRVVGAQRARGPLDAPRSTG